MQGKRMQAFVRGALTLVVATIWVVTPGSAHATSDAGNYSATCGQYWPTSGEVQTTNWPGSDEYVATFRFRLTQAQLNALSCVDYHLEIDFRIYGFNVPDAWEGYQVSGTNLPGAIHDVAFEDSADEAAPAASRIYVDQLTADTDYHVTLAWSAPRRAGVTPSVSVEWIPSQWTPEWWHPVCWAPAITLGSQAWCSFGRSGARVYISSDLFGGTLPFDGFRWYKFGPASGTLSGSAPQSPGSGGSSPPPSRQMFLRGDSTVFAKDSFGSGGWTQETDPGSINKITAGGNTQLVLNACNAVYARTTIGNGGWVQETPCGGATQIAVSSAGVQMLIDANSAVWAKVGIGYGGWTRETDDRTAYAIAAGGNTQMIITACRAIYAKSTIGYGGWNHEVGCGNANAITIDNTGLQAFIRGDAAVFAKRGIGDGNWLQQVGPGNAQAIAVGGGVLMFLRGDSAVFAKTNIGIDGGWTQETAPGTANLIAVNGQGRQMIRTGDNAIWAKDGISYGGWTLQAGPGNANAIAIG